MIDGLSFSFIFNFESLWLAHQGYEKSFRHFCESCIPQFITERGRTNVSLINLYISVMNRFGKLAKILLNWPSKNSFNLIDLKRVRLSVVKLYFPDLFLNLQYIPT